MAPAPSGSGFFLQNLGNLGLGFSIAIALAFLVLLSTILLASYVCCRARRNSVNPSNPNPNPNSETIVAPRIIYVAEENSEEEEESNVAGLDQNMINSYQKFEFSKSKDHSSGDSACSICLGDYKDGEMLRMLPDCRHLFHLVCVDSWLRLNASCPVCRNSPLPTPLSTPLSELVPLSHYPVT